MHSNQRNDANNQSGNGGNERDTNAARAGTAGHTGAPRAGGTYEETGAQPSGAHQPGFQNTTGSARDADHAGSPSARAPAPEMAHEGNADDRQSNDLAGGLPRSPAGSHLAADEKMNDDTGLSNTANRQAPAAADERQEEQSNVGRRSDGTPD